MHHTESTSIDEDDWLCDLYERELKEIHALFETRVIGLHVLKQRDPRDGERRLRDLCLDRAIVFLEVLR